MQLVSMRKTAALTGLSEKRIKRMKECGQLPGIYAGERFLVDVDALMEMFQTQITESVSKERR